MVVLQSVNLSTTGRYRCEVSAEAPSFQTVSDHGDMIVVEKPVGINTQLSVGLLIPLSIDRYKEALIVASPVARVTEWRALPP
ncbi:hypothetical protein Bhyg_04911 [Pseudolycoriella hygida]|uniref:Uncharacterized protein n=1 Tax=Pseudolycoriella hygida TaxID=35572 RepID=A0A9Q0S8X6_9DIPT|nr:hypothetical protein Bhyg_04911 [Pseudolycoriella hygida]